MALFSKKPAKAPSYNAETVAFLKGLERQAKAQILPVRASSSRQSFVSSDWNVPSGNGGFKGGGLDRLTEGWNPGNVGPNQAHQRGGAIMRQRARDLVLNNPLAKSAVDAYVSNVIEMGITPKPSFPDKDARQKWVSAWNRWGGMTAHSTRECDIAQQDTIYELQALWLSEIIIGGGCLAHYVELPRKGRSIPIAIELLPEERFAEDVIQWGANPKTANPVVNGCEIEKSTGRTIAYHVRQTNNLADAQNQMDFDPVRLLREDCEYSYFRTRLGQTRGHSLLHAAIMWLWALGYYVDNELYASNVKSSYAVMIKTSSDAEFDWNVLNESCESGTTDIYGNPLTVQQPGMIFRGMPGDEITGVGPNVPGSDGKAWIEMIQRSIAVGCGVSYEEIVRDFSKGSFSSVRASANSDRRRFRRVWKFTDAHFNNPTYLRFAKAGVRAGLDGFPSPQTFMSEMDEWLAVKWEGPSWESVNPSDDAKADDIRIKNLTKTRSACIPGDIDDHFDDLEREQKVMDAKGLKAVLPGGQASDAEDDTAKESEADQKQGAA